MAATTIDTLLVRIEADLSQVKNQLGQFDSRLDATQKKASSSLNTVGRAFKGVVGLLVVRELARGSMALVNFVSGIEEMQSKSSVVFGAFAGDVRKDLAEFGAAVGRSKFELEAMAASVQDTFVPMGFARGEAAKLSVELTKLATDAGSFYNASDASVMEAFQSALVGNHETVRRFGVVITEATLQQELFRMGINKTSQEASNAEKVQARLNLITKGLGDAQGDALRTAGSFENRTKDLGGALEELAVSAIQPLMGDLATFVGHLTDAVRGTQAFLVNIGLIPKDLSAIPAIVAEITKKEAELALARQAAADADKRNNFASSKSRSDSRQELENEIAALKAKIEQINKATEAARKAKEEEAKNSGNKPTNDVAVQKARDAIAALKEENRLLKLEVDGSSEAVLEQEKALGKLTEVGELESAQIKSLIQEQVNLKNQLEKNTEKTNAKTAAEEKAADVIKDLENQNNLLFLSVVGATEAELKAFEAKQLLNGATDEQIKKIRELIAENENLKKEVTDQEDRKAANDNVNDELRRRQEELAVLQATLGGATDAELELLDVMQRHANLTPEQVEKFRELIAEHENLRAATQAQTEMQESLEAAFTKAGQAVSDALVDGLLEGKVSLDDFTSIFKDFIKELIREAIRAYLIKKILGSIFGSIGGFGGGGGDANITATGGSGFAGGGAVRGFAGGGSAPMLVGERGPELFVPHSAGSIKNNMDTKNILAGAGGGVVVNQTINVETGVSQTVRAEMLSLLPSIKQDTIQAVADARRRGGTFAQAFGG